MRVETLKARCIFIQSCISFRDKNLEKIYKLDGSLTAYCLIFANPNIHQNTRKFMYFLKQAWKIDISIIVCLLLVHKNRYCINRENSVFRHFVNFSSVITGKRHDMMINNELWHTPTAISFKYMKDLQTLNAWNGRNMHYNMTMSELKNKSLVHTFIHFFYSDV